MLLGTHIYRCCVTALIEWCMHMNRLVRFWRCDITYEFMISLCTEWSYLHNRAMRMQASSTVHPWYFCQRFPLVVILYDAVHLCLALEAAIPWNEVALRWSSGDVAFPGAPTFSGFGWALHNFGRRGCVCFGFDFLAYFQPKNGGF